MTEPLVSDRAVEFDGKIIGHVHYLPVEDKYNVTEMDGGMTGMFRTREAAHAWLVERYAKAQEGE